VIEAGSCLGSRDGRGQPARAPAACAPDCRRARRGVAGCASGEIYLWQFGARAAAAGYTPLLPAASAPAPAAASLFSAPARAWSLAAPGALAALGHWGQPQAVRARPHEKSSRPWPRGSPCFPSALQGKGWV